MSSVYPGALDNLPDVADGEVIEASIENGQSDAVNAIETTLGINPQGSYSTVAAAVVGKLDIASANMTGNTITNLGTPVNPSDAATKSYVDNSTLTVDNNGTAVGSRKTINFIASGAATLAIVDNSAANRVDVTIGAPSGNGTSGTALVFEDVGCTIDGGGTVPVTGIKAFRKMDYAGTITEVDVIADQSGNCTIDLYKDTLAHLPVSPTQSITGGNYPSLSSSQTSSMTTFTGWTTVTISAGDVIAFVLNSATTVTRITVNITIQRAINTLGGSVVTVYETLGITIDGDGAVPSTGFRAGAIRRVDFNCNITGWTLIGNGVGSAVLDVWVATSLSSVPSMSSANSITGGSPPTMSSAQTASSITLTGWTVALAAGDFVGFNLSSISGMTLLMLALTVERT
ncbi:MAG TPA: hypothetical protein VGO93_16105 [Candidatus Xenobia bacterium]|jgi:hypothetical protein